MHGTAFSTVRARTARAAQASVAKVGPTIQQMLATDQNTTIIGVDRLRTRYAPSTTPKAVRSAVVLVLGDQPVFNRQDGAQVEAVVTACRTERSINEVLAAEVVLQDDLLAVRRGG